MKTRYILVLAFSMVLMGTFVIAPIINPSPTAISGDSTISIDSALSPYLFKDGNRAFDLDSVKCGEQDCVSHVFMEDVVDKDIKFWKFKCGLPDTRIGECLDDLVELTDQEKKDKRDEIVNGMLIHIANVEMERESKNNEVLEEYVKKGIITVNDR